MFRIGDFSKLTQVSIRMLRYYDELDLLKPEEVDKFTGYRFYSAKQISRLNKIITLRDMGFLTAEISEILKEDSGDALLIRLEKKREEIITAIEYENKKLKKLEKVIETVERESVCMDYEVKLKSIPQYKVVSLREVIPAYDKEGILWQKLGSFMEKQGIQCTSPAFAMYHDLEYREADVDIEVAMCVDELLEGREGFNFRETEAVPHMASMMVKGAFENIGPAYNALAEWIEKNNYKMTGTSRQVCHCGPWNESNPDNYLTEIQIPVDIA